MTMTARGTTFQPERDGTRLANQYDVVKAYVLGRDWTSLREISEATGYPEASVSARLRDCRARGYLVERRFITRGLHLYKVSVATPVQLDLLAAAPPADGDGGGPRLPAVANQNQLSGQAPTASVIHGAASPSASRATSGRG